jgi:hypothetical protein
MSKKPKRLTEPPTKGSFYDVIGIEESDRGCVLAAHGYCDGRLEELLRAKFQVRSGETNKLIDSLFNSGHQPLLQSFQMKLVMARVLQLIDEHSFRAFTKFNDLRNHFAHYPGIVTLSAERVRVIHDLMPPERQKHPARDAKMAIWTRITKRQSPARKMFARVFIALSSILNDAIHLTDMTRLKSEWIAEGRNPDDINWE